MHVHSAMKDESQPRGSRCGRIVKANSLVLLTLVGVALGLSTGFATRRLNPTATTVMWIGMVGELYMRILKLMIVPLIITAILSVTSSMDPKSNGRISAVCLVYTLVCNFVPSVLGCVLCMAIPFDFTVDDGLLGKETRTDHNTDTNDVMADLLRNLFPDNLIEATFVQTQTMYSDETSVLSEYTVNGTQQSTRSRQMSTVRSPNVLGLVVICTLFGIASGVLRDVSKPFQAFFEAASEIIMQVLRWVMWITPIGVASLIAKTICSVEDIEGDFQKLGMFILASTGGMILCGLIVPVSYAMLRRTNPFPFLLSFSQPIMMAFATANTPITMPAVMTILETDHGVDKRVSRFVMPFIMTLGRTGTAIYIAMSTVFVCRMTGKLLNVANLTLICLLTTITSTGAPPVPSSALMTVIIVIATLNIPTEAVTLLYTFDWFLDRFRSIVNLLFQAFAAILVQDLCGKSLPSLQSVTKEFSSTDNSIEIHIDENQLQELSDIVYDNPTYNSTTDSASVHHVIEKM